MMNNKTPDIHIRLSSVVESIESYPLRGLVTNVFDKLSDLLEYLDFFEGCLRSEELLLKSHLMLRLLNEKSTALVTYIESSVESSEHVTDALRTLMDSTNFAIRHEVGRVAVAAAPGPNQPLDIRLAELTRAHGILRNCFQQSVISLALVFDSTITSIELFDDFRLKREQSTILLEALTILIDQTNETTNSRDLDSYFALVEGLKMFRQGYMNYLNYSDWAEFESLAENITTARTEFELSSNIHRFSCYLNTLIGHVRMRAVFHDQQVSIMEVA